MAYDQKKQAGRAPMMKTGRGIPPQFYGPQLAQDGVIDDIKAAAKKVANKISTAHNAGMDAYYGSTKSANSVGDFGGGSSGMRRSYSRNPAKYFSGAVRSLVND